MYSEYQNLQDVYRINLRTVLLRTVPDLTRFLWCGSMGFAELKRRTKPQNCGVDDVVTGCISPFSTLNDAYTVHRIFFHDSFLDHRYLTGLYLR